ncbi:MAG: isocitrate lyase/phosphoenolpyruvate mutase family protein [Trueperaceae bacterium]
MSTDNVPPTQEPRATIAEKRARFRAMHEDSFFLLPNPWVVGSAKRLERLGFPALASTSSGLAWSLGLDDQQVGLHQVLDHLTTLATATDLPLNADFEHGFARASEAVATNVRLAAATGVAGLSIEDFRDGALYDEELAAERIRAARAALDEVDENIVLVGRCEILLMDPAAIDVAVNRLVAYAEAGADCLYAPGVSDPRHIARIVEAVAPKPVNVLSWGESMRPKELAELGVRRMSVGGKLARAAWEAFDVAARSLARTQAAAG